jgi:hypothetical protein
MKLQLVCLTKLFFRLRRKLVSALGFSAWFQHAHGFSKFQQAVSASNLKILIPLLVERRHSNLVISNWHRL